MGNLRKIVSYCFYRHININFRTLEKSNLRGGHNLLITLAIRGQLPHPQTTSAEVPQHQLPQNLRKVPL